MNDRLVSGCCVNGSCCSNYVGSDVDELASPALFAIGTSPVVKYDVDYYSEGCRIIVDKTCNRLYING